MDDNNNNGNNNPIEPYDDPQDDASAYLITENPYSLFSAPSPTLTLPPPPPPSTHVPEPSLTEQDDNLVSNKGDEQDFSFLDEFTPSMFEFDSLNELDFKINEEINVGQELGGGDLGAGPSGTKELAFQDIQQSVPSSSQGNSVCDIIGSSNDINIRDNNNNNDNDEDDNNNNLQNNNQQQNNPLLSPLFDGEAEGADDDQLLDDIDLENVNNVNVAEPVYPWMAELVGSDSSDSEGSTSGARPSIAIQRERTAQWTLLDLAPYFHMKAERASRKLKISPTTLKIVCRRLHLGRWPYRKISSIDNKITGLKRSLKEKVQQGNVQGIISLTDEIEKVGQKRIRLYQLLLRRGRQNEAN